MHLAHDIIKGQKTPLVFIHGFCEDRSVWDNYLHYFKGHTILNLDMPGFGTSNFQENLSIEKIVDLVHELIKSLKLKKIILIGHSMGGYVTCSFAKKYENLLKGICLFHSHPFADHSEKKEDRKKAIAFIKKNGSKGFVDALIPKLFSEENELNYPKEIVSMKEKAYAYKNEAVIEGMEAMLNREDHSKTLESLKIPVLSLLGKKDRITTFDVCHKQSVLPNIGMLHFFENLGHQGMIEDPDLTSAALKEFIKLCDVF